MLYLMWQILGAGQAKAFSRARYSQIGRGSGSNDEKSLIVCTSLYEMMTESPSPACD
jgi:hypothetical protein